MSFPNPRGEFPLGLGRAIRRSARVQNPPPVVPDRTLDGIPGFLAWMSMLLVVIGAIFAPWTIYSIAAVISAYMATRITLAGVANLIGTRRIRRWENTDWHAEYSRRCQANLANHTNTAPMAWDGVLHLVIIPNYKEDLGVLRRTLERLALSSLAQNQLAVVLAMESGDPNAHQTAAMLTEEFAPQFKVILPTFHPRGLLGEIPGKSANEAWAVLHARRHLVEELGYISDNIIITISDADSLLHPKYLECLTCMFASDSNRHSQLWQSPIRYHSNVWEINPALSLVQAYSSAWELAYLSGAWWQAMPISTYSLSMKLVEEVGFWDTDVIAEDWHMFIKCYFGRGGKMSITPIYLPFSGYAVTGNGFLDACRNRYAQTLRHAWGAKEIGYTLKQMAVKPTPIQRAMRVLLRVAHDHLMAGAGWVIMTFGTQLPFLLKPELVKEGMWSPQSILLYSSILLIGIVGFLFWAVDMRLRPPRPHRWTVREVLGTIVSFALLPTLVLFLVALPAIEAQTRLMLGIPLDYRVARKV